MRFVIPDSALGLFAGPAPSSGLHFVSGNALFNNETIQSSGNVNLLSWINRLQNFQYNISTNRKQIAALGYAGLIDNCHYKPPTVNLSFDYVQMGVINEATLGLYTNYLRPSSEVQTMFSSDQFLLGGFYNRELVRDNVNPIGYPYSYRDCRNLFLVIDTSEGEDLNRFSSSGVYYGGLNVIGFGNCYATEYRSSAEINRFPIASWSYIADNIVYQNSGSGMPVPALNTKTYDQYTGIKYTIPNNFQNDLISTLLPGDITLTFTSTPKPTGCIDVSGVGVTPSYAASNQLGVDITKLNILGYDLSIPINRLELNSISHRLPVDRILNLPIVANVSFNVGLDQYKTGNFNQFTRYDDEYNFKIQLNNPICASYTGVGIEYNIKRAKFNGISAGNQINGFHTYSMNYLVDMDPYDLSKGVFMSGLLNIYYDTGNDLLMQEEGEYILTEESERIIIQGRYLEGVL